MTDREVLRNTSLESLLEQVRHKIRDWRTLNRLCDLEDDMDRTIEAIDLKLELERETTSTSNRRPDETCSRPFPNHTPQERSSGSQR